MAYAEGIVGRKLLQVSLAANLVLFFIVVFAAYESEEADRAARTAEEASVKGWVSSYRASRIDFIRNVDVVTGAYAFIGDSITEGGAWRELLGRMDVVNMGIGGDTIRGVSSRLEACIAGRPFSKIFVMAGINDVKEGTDTLEIEAGLDALVCELKRLRVNAVLQSILYVSDRYPGHRRINASVAAMNARIESAARNNSFVYIDLNSFLARGGSLRSELTYDGIHLNALGYRSWKGILESHLRN